MLELLLASQSWARMVVVGNLFRDMQGGGATPSLGHRISRGAAFPRSSRWVEELGARLSEGLLGLAEGFVPCLRTGLSW